MENVVKYMKKIQRNYSADSKVSYLFQILPDIIGCFYTRKQSKTYYYSCCHAVE